MRKYILFASFLLICLSIQAQTTVFVSSTATDDTGDGSTWETAKRSIGSALTTVGNNGTVFVMAGYYSISSELVIPMGVTVMGGYKKSSVGTDTSQRRLPGVNSHWSDTTWCTIINGAGDHRIATVGGLLDGCVVRNGYSNTIGGGLLIDGGTAQYCIIKECDAINDDDYNAEGGGAYIRNNGVLQNSVVTECRADNGVGVTGEDGALINNTITRNAPIGCGSVVDYDGNYYSTVLIGEQCWMRENLRTRHFANGVEIVRGLSNNRDVPYYYHDNWTDENIAKTGLLYNWSAVMYGAESSNEVPSGVQGVCPNGWHVPSSREWSLMINYVAGIPRYWCNNNSTSLGKALATKTRWNGYYSYECYCGNYPAYNNLTRFSAVPSGYYNNGFGDYGGRSLFWSTTSYNSNNAWFQNVYNDGRVPQEYTDKYHGFSVRCVRDAIPQAADSQTIPTVTTADPTNVATTTATGGGNVVNDGGADVTTRGVCWSTSNTPTLTDSHTSDGTGTGEFTSDMTGLIPGVTYYVRAYATNSWGTGYGESKTFTMQIQACPGAATLTDVDGISYGTVQIGNQCWMKENLRVKHYADGSDLTYLLPNNTPATESTYGLLYNWSTVMHGANTSGSNPSFVQGICPTGWHVPSQAEWEQLKSYLNGQNVYRCDNNNDYVAKSLASKTGWANYNSGCCVGWEMNSNNTTGFSAMPAGWVETNGTNYRDFGYGAKFWSASSTFRTQIWHSDANFNFSTENNNNYFSVRCVKD
ncbi:MAG: fibrobacter succinogenes major paralogous domain-containing protein [Bacteroidales bacterium]|nr:fibrobacter succinogenes major paralogous domain-containing protein [Bacteroidales bacterium]